MKAYFWAFVNFEQNNWVRPLLIVEFAYNNAKNASTGHTPFELNYGYHPCIFFKEDINTCSWSKLADELSVESQDPMTICQENLHHAQEF